MRNRYFPRRTLLNALALGAAASAAFGVREAWGAEAQRLEESDPEARARSYVEDASRVDARKHPDFVPGSNCENCLQLQGSPGRDFRPCALFAGKLVAAKGWCSGWTPEI